MLTVLWPGLALGLVLFGASNATAAGVAAARGAALAPAALDAAAFAPALALGAAIASRGGGKSVVTEARELVNLQDCEGGYLELYYKVSVITTLVVGGAFAFSPESPLSLVNASDPASQLLQRTFGLGACFMLAPAQAVLASAASKGEMRTAACRALNLAIAASIAGIDWSTIVSNDAAQRVLGEGDAQVAYESLESLGSASGGIANYVAALLVSGLTLAVYLYQGLPLKRQES